MPSLLCHPHTCTHARLDERVSLQRRCLSFLPRAFSSLFLFVTVEAMGGGVEYRFNASPVYTFDVERGQRAVKKQRLRTLLLLLLLSGRLLALASLVNPPVSCWRTHRTSPSCCSFAHRVNFCRAFSLSLLCCFPCPFFSLLDFPSVFCKFVALSDTVSFSLSLFLFLFFHTRVFFFFFVRIKRMIESVWVQTLVCGFSIEGIFYLINFC